MKDPFFTVIIPIYNREKIIEKTLESLRSQIFKDFETIIVDDSSTDNSYQVAMSFDLNNKVVLRNENNSERCISRNNGIKISRGKYICFLDSDDTFLPNHLSTFYENITKSSNKKALFFCNSLLENEQGVISEKSVPFLNRNKFAYLLLYTPNPARVCIEKSILEEFDFDPAIPGIEDLDLWLRIASKYPIIHIEEYTSVYFIHSQMYTLSDHNRFEKELAFFKYVFNRDELKKNLPKSSKNRLLSMCHYHLALKSGSENKIGNMYNHAIKSFLLYPKGYNGRTNKPLFVICLYNLPILGRLSKSIINIFKTNICHSSQS